MLSAEWVGVVIGFIGLVGLFLGMLLDNRRKRLELLSEIEMIKRDKEAIEKERVSIQRDRETIAELKTTMKTIMDYISVQREEIRVLQSQLSSQRVTSEEALRVHKEQLAWNKLAGLAKALGWIVDRIPDEE